MPRPPGSKNKATLEREALAARPISKTVREKAAAAPVTPFVASPPLVPEPQAVQPETAVKHLLDAGAFGNFPKPPPSRPDDKFKALIERVEQKADTAAPLPPPTRPDAPNLRPSHERHVLRGVEEYPDAEQADTKFFIDRGIRPGTHPRYPQGRKGDYPDGFDLQWVAISVWGQPLPQFEAEYARKGWQAVYPHDFDGRYAGRFVPHSHQGPIVLDGLMLMARPMSWTEKARGLASREAHNQVAIKVNQLQQGELDKVTLDTQHKHLDKTNYVRTSIEGVGAPGGPPLTD